MKYVIIGVHDPKFIVNYPGSPLVTITVVDEEPSKESIDLLTVANKLKEVGVTAMSDAEGQHLKSILHVPEADPTKPENAYQTDPRSMAVFKLCTAIYNLGSAPKRIFVL